jgi:hypothetical protein
MRSIRRPSGRRLSSSRLPRTLLTHPTQSGIAAQDPNDPAYRFYSDGRAERYVSSPQVWKAQAIEVIGKAKECRA